VRDGTHDDPFSVLGPHGGTVRVFEPDALRRSMSCRGTRLRPCIPWRAFPAPSWGIAADGSLPARGGEQRSAPAWAFDDPYRFGPVLGEIDEYLIGEGTHGRLWDALGAHVRDP
jgi:1,4-alpha-glucan branching enzyme